MGDGKRRVGKQKTPTCLTDDNDDDGSSVV